jgi:hypothetical protein
VLLVWFEEAAAVAAGEEGAGCHVQVQGILSGDSPPHLWVVLDEGVLHRHIGDAKTMLDQLWHIVRTADCPRVSIQVVPFDAGERTGLLGAFSIADLDGAPSGARAPTAAATAGNCVEVARSLPRAVAVRDSKDPGGPQLGVSPAAW